MSNKQLAIGRAVFAPLTVYPANTRTTLSSLYHFGFVLVLLGSVFTARCYASAVLAMTLCLSVRPSVRPSQAGVLLKRQNIGSHKQHHTIPQGPQISAKFDRGHPLRGRQMQVGWVKIGNFREIIGYISKTVKDRHIVSIKVE